MWLRKLVGFVMIVTLLGMNGLVLIGFFSPEKRAEVGFAAPVDVLPPEPTVAITAKPDAISAGSFSALTWTTTNSPDACVASDKWSGPKTAFGAESTGRLSTPGTYTYTLTCTNKGGSAKASVLVAVGAASAPVPTSLNKGGNGTATSSGVTYCNGRLPCYSKREIATHGSKGNCWGWNGNRVINISGFDAGFHVAKSGISSIEISQVCGKDLAPSLNGSVSPPGQPTRDHNPTTKSNSDSHEIPYFVGYYDSKKP